MTRLALTHPAITAALATAMELLGMEAAFIGGLSDEEFVLERVSTVEGQPWDALSEGGRRPRQDSFCHRMLAGAPPATADAAHDPAYASLAVREELGISSYVGVPITSPSGEILGTLCGIDRSAVPVTEQALHVLRSLASVIGTHLEATRLDGVIIRRTAQGWSVEGDDSTDEGGDLITSMVLADLLAQDLSPGSRPGKPEVDVDEVTRLRASVTQLEHALAARVVVEQAIGVLAERRRTTPRQAFESLRRVARSHGWRVHDLAVRVVASVTEPATELPDGLG
ncbi:MAG TPA: GAF and ANTAR domain-containing protein [Mycobacteriales bacterium]|jgi:hypothetical protein|nr:GAF and ANTAR domain-containing protein [Mycobacteriales bacterium]